jgi:hypothetical protein
MRDGVVLFDTRSEHGPRHPIGTEEVDLGIGHDERRVRMVEHETRTRQGGVQRFGVVGVVCHGTAFEVGGS